MVTPLAMHMTCWHAVVVVHMWYHNGGVSTGSTRDRQGVGVSVTRMHAVCNACVHSQVCTQSHHGPRARVDQTLPLQRILLRLTSPPSLFALLFPILLRV